MKSGFLLILLGSCRTIGAFHASLPCSIDTLRNCPQHGYEKFDVFIVGAVSNEDAIERLRRQQMELSSMEQEKPPMIFDQEIVDEINAAYITLEKRTQQGPGSLARYEMQELELRLHKIMHEMRANEHLRRIKPPTTSREELGGATVIAASRYNNPMSMASRESPIDSRSWSSDSDTSEDEGPRYDGFGGMGQPRGTVNTYVIPGMDEMSKDEYMKALQDQISNVQNERRRSGLAGNRSSRDYLKSLSNPGVLNQNVDNIDNEYY
jgi:hypothetical protein